MAKIADKESIKASFLQNIGSVIKRKRKYNNYSVENLASDLGCDTSSISRYENGRTDISASAMAYISYVLNFDLIEYAIKIDTGCHMSQIFKELVAVGAKKSSISQQIEKKDKKKRPKYDRTDLDGNVIPTLPRQRPQKDNILDPPSEAEDKMFEDYLSGDESLNKARLMSVTYKIMVEDMDDEPEDIKTAIRAITRYIASDYDKATNERLKDYLRKCQSLL